MRRHYAPKGIIYREREWETLRMKHESDKEGQSGKSHLFETGGISAVFFPPALLNLEVLRSKVFWKRWDVGCGGQMSLSLSSHFNRWRWWINLLLISGWILHFCCKMPNGKILGSESDNTETQFHGDINVLAMKLMMCFFSSDKVLMFWWRTADYLKCYLWKMFGCFVWIQQQ